MRYDGLPKVCLSLSILGLTILSANSSVTRLTPDAHVYQVQLLGNIMLVCPETFDRSKEDIDCARWLRRTRGGSTVFVQPMLPPDEPTKTHRPKAAPRIATLQDLREQSNTLGRIVRPRARPTDLSY
jgi:hypothetical protein